MKSRRLGGAVLALLVVAAVAIALRRPSREMVLRPVSGPRAPTDSSAGAGRLAAGSVPVAGNPTGGDEPSRLADQLNSPAGDVHADLRILNEIFTTYRSSTHQENPVGENAEITAALTGKNAVDYAFIPPNSPAINARGELCDRWGTPYFFHQLSGTEMQIRSAGPDRKLWTADDEVMEP